MSRPVLSSATRRLQQSTAHCQRPFSTTRFFSASSEPITRSSSIYNADANATSLHASTRPSRYTLRRVNISSFSVPRHRAFSSSTIRLSAKVVQNARNDEEGKPFMVGISERAAERLREITDSTTSPTPTKTENPYHHLRITVTSGGCHGFQYMMSLEAMSKIDAEEDTVFEADAKSGPEGGEALVVMDEPSLELLSGSTVDYTTELIGSQFKIVDNPRASSNCGCGTSFDVSL
ncbi:uncharacterized protein ASPGLDRAFT_38433 [Aspergillus glaucus CBS 516.65]|uniref:Core domain-containing protein n=1 Tax=Aspergillus glaucus CBS 516.65 TaxID=1160497 RepID=A0A1L9VBB8_ASPGL|nr:hypothetical protein ASPGLDRAFT_38433 [Aspergillus glaucus CBS 516.65]OJJ81238.1 hypothetical protein ASPGLDRAFT_38433 [Aspergillus glaucus CBS 516.65]